MARTAELVQSREYLYEDAPIVRRVRFFVCNNTERQRVEAIIGRPTTAAELQAAVEAAAALAVTLGNDGAAALRAVPRTAATRAFFQEAFGVGPEFVPAWRLASFGWRDLGELVAIRLRNAASILNGGWIHYFCWGSPGHCPECPGDPSTYFACSSFGQRFVICLGANFWRAFGNNDTDTMASTLLHEALHIYFGTTVADNGRTGNANCYERFVIRLAGRFLHPATAANCPAATTPPAVTNRPTVSRGSRGNAVQNLQIRLNVWSAATPASGVQPLIVDGIFGARTEAAVRAFQRHAGIAVDGIVGPQTWGHLIAATPMVQENEAEAMFGRLRSMYGRLRSARMRPVAASNVDRPSPLPAPAPAPPTPPLRVIRGERRGGGGRPPVDQIFATLLRANTMVGEARYQINELRNPVAALGTLASAVSLLRTVPPPFANNAALRQAIRQLDNYARLTIRSAPLTAQKINQFVQQVDSAMRNISQAMQERRQRIR